MLTAAAYIRVSTEDQIEYSPASQVDALRRYAKANDMILPEELIFSDEGISGRKAEKRPEFQRMIGAAKTKPRPFDVILVWKFSRFARNREDSIIYKSMLQRECGIDVISISENTGDDKMSVIIEALIEAMDEYYSLNLGEEVKRGNTEKAKRGEVVTLAPFGYAILDSVYIPCETTPYLVEVFERYCDGASIFSICKSLNNREIYTIFGNRWTEVAIRNLLKNKTYIGVTKYDGKEYAGKHAPIISAELFEKAQERLRLSAESAKKYRREGDHTFMLKGLVRCSACGSTLVNKTTGLQCNKYLHGICEVSHYISFAKINNYIIEQIKSDLKNPIFKVSPPKNQPATPDNSGAIAIEQRKLERAKQAYTAGVDTLEEYAENKRKILEQIKILESEQVNLPQNDVAVSDELRKTITVSLDILKDKNISEELKNKILRSFISEIIFDRKKDCLTIVYYC